mmetsp:Transcript_116731/g.293592  ORF Transcript_116731/g.293592 Transcript_116731/m.293592 type:complete len:155 (-) Transcript_116731:412-876(-)
MSKLCLVVAMLVPCVASAAGPPGGEPCGTGDLSCHCRAMCDETCHHFNISNPIAASKCAACMASKCPGEAVKMCEQGSMKTCKSCITQGSMCWMTAWAPCAKSCVKKMLDPFNCPKCWMRNYTWQCLRQYDHCFNHTTPPPPQQQQQPEPDLVV